MMEDRVMFKPVFDWSKVDREILAYGTTRGLRLTRVGMVFFVESAKLERDEDGETVEWKVVAVAKGQDPAESYQEACAWLAQANIEVIETIRRDRHSGKRGADSAA